MTVFSCHSLHLRRHGRLSSTRTWFSVLRKSPQLSILSHQAALWALNVFLFYIHHNFLTTLVSFSVSFALKPSIWSIVNLILSVLFCYYLLSEYLFIVPAHFLRILLITLTVHKKKIISVSEWHNMSRVRPHVATSIKWRRSLRTRAL